MTVGSNDGGRSEGVPYQDLWAYQPNTKGVLYQSSQHIDEDVKWLENEPEKVDYPTQKPLGLLRRIVESSTESGDMVLDPFCGCATACIAAEKAGREWVGIDLSPLAAELVVRRADKEIGGLFKLHHRTDIPLRTDLGKLPNYRTHKHTLFGRQEGKCAGCKVLFPFRNFTLDHVIPKSRGGTDHQGNLQLLCGACNSLKGTKRQEEFMAVIRKISI